MSNQNTREAMVTIEPVGELGQRKPGLKRVLTYGTFDLLHYGHIRLLQRASQLGDYLIVALSTDEFNAVKGKKSFYPYETRKEMLEGFATLTWSFLKMTGLRSASMLPNTMSIRFAWVVIGRGMPGLRI